MKPLLCAACAFIAAIGLSAAAIAAPKNETPLTFTAPSGETVEAFDGAFTVPENYDNPDSRKLTLHYIRFPATTSKPGAPIVYLAGGPGGSGIWMAQNFRFPLFMALREFGDVIALDQRGTGASNDIESCASSLPVDDMAPPSDEEFFAQQREALRECIGQWSAKGVDLKGYTTLQSVNDLEELRRHLGARKLSLWGISYGTHLALAALKEMDAHIDRVILASAEGLDQTIKYPARTDEYFGRLQAAIDTQDDAKARYPDIKEMMRRVHASLESYPVTLSLPQRDGGVAQMLFTRRDMQRIASAMIANPNRYARQLIEIYAAADQGDTAPLAAVVFRFYQPNSPITFEAMPVMMDIASGVSPVRRALVEEQAKTALLGPFLNDTLYLLDAAPEYQLGDDFRKGPYSKRPVLLLTGTLDGRTYIESQKEAVAGLSKTQFVTVRNAGHNLFMVSPEVTETIKDFMRGENVDGREIVIDLPTF